MAQTAYGDISPRTAAYAAKDLLKRGLPYLVLEKFGQMKELPAQNSKIIKFRRYNALPTTPTALTEGVTPAGQTLAVTDVTATLTQYGDKVTITDVVEDTHEDPVLQESLTLIGEQSAQMIEKVRFGVIKAGTNVLWTNGTQTNQVNTALDLTTLRRAVRQLKRQNARAITKVVRSTPAYATQNIEPAFVALVHPDGESTIRSLAGFVPASAYGALSPWENELGAVEGVRFVTSTIFDAAKDAGGAKGSMISNGGTSADVYPVIVLGSDAWAGVALKGKFAITPMVVNPKPSDSDPLAQRGHVSWKTMQTAVILNDAFMVRIECAFPA